MLNLLLDYKQNNYYNDFLSFIGAVHSVEAINASKEKVIQVRVI